MELFIRSQDKTRLFKFDDLKIECTCEEMPSCGSYKICDVCEDIIAIYETKTRALEVLDEIQEKIKNGIGILNNKSYTEGSFRDHELVIDIPYTKIIVYEMPEE